MTKILGTRPNGDTIQRLTLTGDRLAVDLLTLGSILEAVRLDGGPSMTIPPDDPLNRPGDAALIGPIVAPVINRLTMPVAFAGADLSLAPVKPEGFVLHSGDGGTHDRVWQVTHHEPRTATLDIALGDGLGGFPGNRSVRVTWTLDGAELRLDIEARTDRATLMNVAHHPYWALDGNGRDGHTLWIDAERYTPSTDIATPTGRIAPVADSDYDFRTTRAPAPGLDANLCLSDTPAPHPRHVATLTSNGGRRLDILTTAPGLQLFTGKTYGIALEPQLWPNAPAHPNFPSIILEPGQTFRQSTIYRFSAT